MTSARNNIRLKNVNMEFDTSIQTRESVLNILVMLENLNQFKTLDLLDSYWIDIFLEYIQRTEHASFNVHRFLSTVIPTFLLLLRYTRIKTNYRH
jgi:hypothetical protein